MNIKIDDLGTYLKNIRKEHNLTLKDVSTKTGLTFGYIGRIEKNSSIPSLETLIILCNVYGLDVNALVDNEVIVSSLSDQNNLDIERLILSDNSVYRGTKITITDKINILKFIDFIVSVPDNAIKKNCMKIIDCINEMKESIEGEGCRE